MHADANGRLKVAVECRPVFPAATNDSRKIVAKLYADEQLDPDGDWKQGPEIWSSTKPISPEDNTSVLGATVKDVKLWSAEEPNLYTLTITLLDGNGKECQAESARVGFRTIEIVDGIVKVNGKKITICGVNRHEHDPDNGKVITHASMKKDIEILKQNNFNAIRTCHYPNDSAFYRYCDYYGMYVCDEAN